MGGEFRALRTRNDAALRSKIDGPLIEHNIAIRVEVAGSGGIRSKGEFSGEVQPEFIGYALIAYVCQYVPHALLGTFECSFIQRQRDCAVCRMFRFDEMGVYVRATKVFGLQVKQELLRRIKSHCNIAAEGEMWSLIALLPMQAFVCVSPAYRAAANWLVNGKTLPALKACLVL